MKLCLLIIKLLSFLGFILSSIFSYGQNKLATQPYLGQTPPGLEPQLFAPDLVSLKGQYEFGSVFSRDGKEFYYAIEVQGKPYIQYCQQKSSGWTKPVTLLKHKRYSYNDPFLSPDEKRLYFISDRALNGNGEKKDIDIWYIERKKDQWSEPINAGTAINSSRNEYYISFTSQGKMYFSSNRDASSTQDKNYDIYTAPYRKGAFLPAQKFGPSVNSEHYEADVFVAPDESYLIYCAERPDGQGQGDLWISFKDGKGTWQSARNMGPAINTGGYEFCLFVTADSQYLFFSRAGDIYWVSTQVIQSLRQPGK